MPFYIFPPGPKGWNKDSEPESHGCCQGEELSAPVEAGKRGVERKEDLTPHLFRATPEANINVLFLVMTWIVSWAHFFSHLGQVIWYKKNAF